MKLLLDTHAFLWFVAGDKRLSRRARHAMEGDKVELVLSAVSVWELAIKTSLGRLSLPDSVANYIAGKVASGFQILPVEWTHAAAVESLPLHHKDPFDRLLVAQSKLEGLPIVSGDAIFRTYKANVVW